MAPKLFEALSALACLTALRCSPGSTLPLHAGALAGAQVHGRYSWLAGVKMELPSFIQTRTKSLERPGYRTALTGSQILSPPPTLSLKLNPSC